MVWRIVTGWEVTMLSFLAVACWWGLQVLPPASYYFEARSMMVPDAPVGADVVLFVDRDIHRPVFGRWTVTVRRQDGEGWVQACPPAHGANNYLPESVLPDPLTLAWWAEGQCILTEPGRYFITTTWAFEPRRLPGTRRSAALVSNVFSVVEIDGVRE